MIQIIIGIGIGLVVGTACGFQLCTFLLKKQNSSLAKKSGKSRSEAEREAKGIIRDAEIQARSKMLEEREKFENSIKEMRREIVESQKTLNKREEMIEQREGNLNRKADVLDRKEQNNENKAKQLEAAQETLKAAQKKAKDTTESAEAMLAKLSGMTREEARRTINEQARQELQTEMGTFIRRHKEEAQKTAERDAQQILVTTMQRYAGNIAADTLTKTVSVRGDENKGRIIGREGRNIRTLEAATGVSIMIDETPDAVVISSFDPYRREIAALALDQLVGSGRINPTRIEEVVAEVEAKMDKTVTEIGTAACEEADVGITDAEVLKMIGKLNFRTSFTQNVLQHAKEVAAFAGMIADEIGLDADLARRVGLLHDIGKVMDQEMEGPHAIVGANFLRQHGETAAVVDGVAGHHGETDSTSIYAVLTSIADTLSSARPGARAENAHIYVKRIEALEKLATSFKGVAKAYVMQAGRDLRIIVNPDEISDNDAIVLARDISGKIENELQYPGQIRVAVIRETRCIEYAR